MILNQLKQLRTIIAINGGPKRREYGCERENIT